MAIEVSLSPNGSLLIGSPTGDFPNMTLGYDPGEAIRRVLKGQGLAQIAGRPFGEAEAKHWLQHHPKGATSGLSPGCPLCAPDLRRARGLAEAKRSAPQAPGKVIVRKVPQGAKGGAKTQVSNSSSLTIDQLFGGPPAHSNPRKR